MKLEFWFTKLFGWFSILAPTAILGIAIPHKICKTYPLNILDFPQCSEGIFYTSIALPIFCYVIAYFIARRYRQSYFILYNYYDFIRFLIHSKSSTIGRTKGNEKEREIRLNSIQNILSSLFILALPAGFLLLIKGFLITLEQISGQSYIDSFFYLLHLNIPLSVTIIAIGSLVLSYQLYKIKKRRLIIYGLLEIVLGMIMSTYTLFSSFLASKPSKPNVYLLLLFVIILIFSLKVIATGFENTVKGLKKYNVDGWLKDYY
ncbi:hypothetical protein OO013_07685 [Mangrovivirga sp. M17]|uniref:Uncharacterized protein n=1 Tax=Mangrovivirga halotolerans TaxID=2993936 RepID=A0ABT3RRC7_9BACT|nr:hypothetical protein [Mangrovivirga halotolerans]MCX2743740.1 hypothetical protein [Mangrovivirga halotolerans]